MKKIKMVVCDPYTYERQYYVMLCRALAKKHGLELELKEYAHGQTLLFDIGSAEFAEMVDILLLEADISEIDGTDIAQQARQLGYKGVILFLTHSTNHYEPAFDAEALNYVRKGKEHIQRFEAVLLKASEAAQKYRHEYMVLSCAGEYRQIAVTDIQYFESRNHIIEVHYENQQFEFISTLTKLENQLFGRGFQRIHKSYLVSLDYIQKISYEAAVLTSGNELPVGRKYYQTLKTALEQWLQ